ncbi:MAG: uracil-DNA glycosylase [Candidatus Delongbacteria bacterium]|nr:uracil-DNA glycosylase [Candidatus Delongbacteria bacterium]
MQTNYVNEAQNISSLEQLKALVENCKLCELHKTRKNTVFGDGSDRSKLVIIGEAPGAEEDKTGLPFVGKSGKLLTKMLEAIGLSRDDVFICNVLKCRPPNNRDPKSEEIKQCSIYLDKQLEILKPKYILALGRISAKRILEKDLTMKDFRKEIHNFKNIPVMVTYHPSALLRNPKWKFDAWEDLKKLKLNLSS